MVEGGEQLRAAHQQRAVAEDVARHVADAGGREDVALGIDAELGEMLLRALPRAARGDRELLVVVALGAARGEGVAEPEVARECDRVGGVREVRRALVGRDDEVGVVSVAPHDVRGRQQLARGVEVVGQVEQARDEDAVLLVGERARFARARDRSASGRSRPWRRPARSARSSASACASGRGSRRAGRRSDRSSAARRARPARRADGCPAALPSARRSRAAVAAGRSRAPAPGRS